MINQCHACLEGQIKPTHKLWMAFGAWARCTHCGAAHRLSRALPWRLVRGLLQALFAISLLAIPLSWESTVVVLLVPLAVVGLHVLLPIELATSDPLTRSRTLRARLKEAKDEK